MWGLRENRTRKGKEHTLVTTYYVLFYKSSRSWDKQEKWSHKFTLPTKSLTTSFESSRTH